MKQGSLRSFILIFLCLALSLSLFSCNGNQPADDDNDGGIVAPDEDPTTDNSTGEKDTTVNCEDPTTNNNTCENDTTTD